MNKRGHNEVKQLTSDSKRNIAACTIPKEKLYCKHCNMKSSHNTSACIKKQKEDKKEKRKQKRGKQKKKNSQLPGQGKRHQKKDVNETSKTTGKTMAHL